MSLLYYQNIYGITNVIALLKMVRGRFRHFYKEGCQLGFLRKMGRVLGHYFPYFVNLTNFPIKRRSVTPLIRRRTSPLSRFSTLLYSHIQRYSKLHNLTMNKFSAPFDCLILPQTDPGIYP